uniref:FAM86 N-terminal domain-containing protein n=1 Tax=Anas zonorhyncha TaxID=75864 RepID=A0A8B9VNM8_9AVES
RGTSRSSGRARRGSAPAPRGSRRPGRPGTPAGHGAGQSRGPGPSSGPGSGLRAQGSGPGASPPSPHPLPPEAAGLQEALPEGGHGPRLPPRQDGLPLAQLLVPQPAPPQDAELLQPQPLVRAEAAHGEAPAPLPAPLPVPAGAVSLVTALGDDGPGAARRCRHRAGRGGPRVAQRGQRRAGNGRAAGSSPAQAAPRLLLAASSARGCFTDSAPRAMAEQEQELGQELGLCFQRRFLAARQLRGFPWPELEQRLRSAPGSSLLADILHQTVLHPLCVKYPPSIKYRRSFLTELIKKVTLTFHVACNSLVHLGMGLLENTPLWAKLNYS